MSIQASPSVFCRWYTLGMSTNGAFSVDGYRRYIEYHHTIDPAWYTDEERKEQDLLEREQLFQDDVSLEKKKRILFKLAHIGKLESITALEKYCKNPDPTLRQWAQFCFDECRSFLESEVLGKNEVIEQRDASVATLWKRF